MTLFGEAPIMFMFYVSHIKSKCLLNGNVCMENRENNGTIVILSALLGNVECTRRIPNENKRVLNLKLSNLH